MPIIPIPAVNDSLARKTNEAHNVEPDALDAPSRDRQPFRFMDLSIELIIRIAEYVLVGSSTELGDRLDWEWTTYDRDRVSGTFLNLDAITPFRLVSRQIHEETLGLVWKVNTLSLDENVILKSLDWNDIVDDDDNLVPMEDEAIAETYRFFLRNTGPKPTDLVRSIVFSVEFSYDDDKLEDLISALAATAKLTPTTQIMICNKNWHATYDPSTLENMSLQPEQFMSEYMAQGFTCQQILSRLGYDNDTNRNWRLFPHDGPLRSDPNWTTELGETDLATVRGWLRNGL
jgi:hypothetical protein